MSSIVLTQCPWRAEAAQADLRGALEAAVAGARRMQLEPEAVLVVLPLASPATSAQERPTEAALLATLGALALEAGAWIGGAAQVRTGPDADAPHVVAFLVGDDGRTRLRAAKITPELVDGFDDSTSMLGRAAPFEVVATPFGQVGLLPGEDALFCNLARALAFHGAELILNPCRERTDDHFDARQAARFTRAGENSCYVAVASPSAVTRDGATLQLPPATALYGLTGTAVRARAGETFIHPDFDLQLLRRIRVNPHRSFPALVRANTYARGYQRAATAAGPAAPAPRSARMSL